MNLVIVNAGYGGSCFHKDVKGYAIALSVLSKKVFTKMAKIDRYILSQCRWLFVSSIEKLVFLQVIL